MYRARAILKRGKTAGATSFVVLPVTVGLSKEEVSGLTTISVTGALSKGVRGGSAGGSTATTGGGTSIGSLSLETRVT